MKALLRVLGVLGLLFVAVFLMGNGLVAPFQFAFNLIFGWSSFAARSLPRLSLDPVAAVGGLGALALSAALGTWLARQLRGAEAPPWPIRATLAALGLVFGLFLTSMASVGVAHQAAWLVHDSEPMTVNSWQRAAEERLEGLEWQCHRLRAAEDEAGLWRVVNLDPKFSRIAARNRTLVYTDREGGLTLAFVAEPVSEQAKVVRCVRQQGEWQGSALEASGLPGDRLAPPALLRAAGLEEWI